MGREGIIHSKPKTVSIIFLEAVLYSGTDKTWPVLGQGPGGLFLPLCPQSHPQHSQLFGRDAMLPGAGVWQIRALWGGCGGKRPPGGAVGRGAGGFPGVPAALPCRGACAVRGCHFGGDCHPVVPVGAERAEQSRAVRAYRHLFAPAADGDDLGAAQRLFKLHRGPVCGGVLFGGGVRLLPAAGRQPAAGPHRRRQAPLQPCVRQRGPGGAGGLCGGGGALLLWDYLWGRVPGQDSAGAAGAHLRPAGRRGRRHRGRGCRWGDSGAFHGGALLPLRGLRPRRAYGGGVLPHGQAGHGGGLYPLPRGGLHAGGGGLSGDDFAGRHRSGRGHHPVHGASQEPTAGPAVRRAQGHPQRRGPAGEHCAAAALRGGGPRPGAYLGGGDFPEALHHLRAQPSGGVRPLGGGHLRRVQRPGGLLAQAQRGDPGKLWPADQNPAGKGPSGHSGLYQGFLRALRALGGDAGRNQQELRPVPA
ncbi:unknown [Firmicutes bacterium CAG:94]|nr:unknown [Firmicutes bacterium CAG:94]